MYFLCNHSSGGKYAGNMVWRQVQESAVGAFYTDMKNVLLSKYEDRWARPHAVVFRTTCSDFYLPFWPADLDQLQHIAHIGGKSRVKEERGSPPPSQLTTRQSFETQWYEADPKITSDNLALSCHVLKRLIRNFWGTWLHLDASHSSHIFSLLLPYFSLDRLRT